jgi:hypothetical protein
MSKWQTMTDSSLPSFVESTGIGGKVWLNFGRDVPIDSIKVVGRDIVPEWMIGCNVSVRNSNGAKTWQTDITTSKPVHTFSVA